MNKEIYFCVDDESMLYVGKSLTSAVTSGSYSNTEELIGNYKCPIITTSIAHLSFDLIDFGYDIYLCYKNNIVKIKSKMQLHIDGTPCKEIRKGHNIFKMFKAGIFDELLGIEKGK